MIRCISAICPAGPPNPRQPILNHTRSASANGTAWACGVVGLAMDASTALSVAYAVAIERDRLYERPNFLSWSKAQPLGRVARDAREDRRASDVDPHVDARAGLGADLGDAAAKAVKHADAARLLDRDRHVARAYPDPQRFSDERVDVGDDQLAARECKAREAALQVLRRDARFDHRAAFVAPDQAPELDPAHQLVHRP